MTQSIDRNTRNAHLLYAIACELLACHLTVYYVLDAEFVGEARTRVTAWLPHADTLVGWLEEDGYHRNQALVSVDYASEPVLDAYLEEGTTIIRDEVNRLFERWKGIEWNMWFYYLYCRWFLRILKEFDRLARSEPIASSSNFESYVSSLGPFWALSEILEREYPDFISMGIDSQTRRELENIMNTTVERLAHLWLQTLHNAHQSIQ